MLELKIGKETFELITNLGTIKRIESQFNHKPFTVILNELEEMNVEDIIKIIGCGIIDKEEKKQLFEKIEENWGYGDLTDVIKMFVDKLTYPGKTDEEIKRKNEEKLAQVKELKEAGLM